MPYFLDGNNLIGRSRNLPRPGEEDRRALIAELCDRLRSTRAHVVVFFDGPAAGGATALGSLSIRSSGGASADEAMLAEIRRARAPREITLVTADRELSRRAREAGARSLAPDAFWKQFGTAPARGAAKAEAVDVDDWMRYFGDEGNRGR